MNDTEKRALRNVIRRLRPEAGVSPQVREALNSPGARIYLDTWVLAPLELLLKEGRTLAELKLAAEL